MKPSQNKIINGLPQSGVSLKLQQSSVMKELLEKHKLIKNEFYAISDDGDYFVIGKCIADRNYIERNNLISMFHILRLYGDHYFNRDRSVCYYTNDASRKYRLATFKERRWLECCIEKDKYIPEKEFDILFRKEKILKLLK